MATIWIQKPMAMPNPSIATAEPAQAPPIPAEPPPQPVPAPASEAKLPKPFKLKKAIENPRQFTVKMGQEKKTALKVLAATLGVSIMSLFADALIDLLANPPQDFDNELPTKGVVDRFGFKVTPQLYREVHDFAEARGVTCQCVIAEASRRFMDKHG